jgi:hypothetical protein
MAGSQGWPCHGRAPRLAMPWSVVGQRRARPAQVRAPAACQQVADSGHSESAGCKADASGGPGTGPCARRRSAPHHAGRGPCETNASRLRDAPIRVAAALDLAGAAGPRFHLGRKPGLPPGKAASVLLLQHAAHGRLGLALAACSPMGAAAHVDQLASSPKPCVDPQLPISEQALQHH